MDKHLNSVWSYNYSSNNFDKTRRKCGPIGEIWPNSQTSDSYCATRWYHAHLHEQCQLAPLLRQNGNHCLLRLICRGLFGGRHPRYIFFYVGNMLSSLYNLHLGNSVTVGVGASTSICAVMGLSFAKLYIDSKKNGRVQLAKRQIIVSLTYLLTISLLPSVDFFGHFGSLISGALLGLIVLPRDDPEVKQLSWLGIAGFSVYTLILFTIFM